MPTILLGISASIAAYKIPDLIRQWKQAGYTVNTILTENATHFVTETTLSTVAETEVITQERFFRGDIPHLSLERKSDIFVVAPATANCIAKFAHGLADDALSTAFLAFQGPKLIVPAMHTEMLTNPITIENIQRLKDLGCECLGPESGALACGDVGKGRMVDPKLIQLKVDAMLQDPLSLKGKKLLITAGGTSERIDPVRVLSNLSTGEMGHQLAHLASFYGAKVRLITSRSDRLVNNPDLADVVAVQTVEDLEGSLNTHIEWADALLMAAAVSDFRPETVSKKLSRDEDLVLKLKATPDLLKGLHAQKGDKTYLGFCLADEHLIETAKSKLDAKSLDIIVANDSSTIGKEIRTVHILQKGHDEIQTLENKVLPQISHAILDALSKALH